MGAYGKTGFLRPLTALEIYVTAHRRHIDWSAIPVVARVVDEAKSKGVEESAPDVKAVIGLNDILAAIVERPVAENEAMAAKLEIFLVVL